jgi:hypothetical protein
VQAALQVVPVVTAVQFAGHLPKGSLGGRVAHMATTNNSDRGKWGRERQQREFTGWQGRCA